jgi:TadE-like protein
VQLRRSESASTAVEFGIIAMAMVMLILGIIEFGRGFYLYNKVSYAVDHAARKGLMNFGTEDQKLIDEILAQFPTKLPESAEEAPLNQIRPKVTITLDKKTITFKEGEKEVVEVLEYKMVLVQILFKPLIPNLLQREFIITVERLIPELS